jgi:hypothetical protein
MIDLDGLARTWIEATDEQRSAWMAAMPANAQLFAPRPGQKPRTAIPGDAGRNHHDGSRLKSHFRHPQPAAT